MPMPHRTFAAWPSAGSSARKAESGFARFAHSSRSSLTIATDRMRTSENALLAEIEETHVRSNAVHRDSVAVRREGAAQIALVGPPNVGKSSLLQALSEIQIKTGDYAFTTLRPVPALTRIGGVLIQLVEIPGLIRVRQRTAAAVGRSSASCDPRTGSSTAAARRARPTSSSSSAAR